MLKKDFVSIWTTILFWLLVASDGSLTWVLNIFVHTQRLEICWSVSTCFCKKKEMKTILMNQNRARYWFDEGRMNVERSSKQNCALTQHWRSYISLLREWKTSASVCEERICGWAQFCNKQCLHDALIQRRWARTSGQLVSTWPAVSPIVAITSWKKSN